jgi:hypothetical protein
MVAGQADLIVEDALCGRLGTLLSEERQSPIDERVGPRNLPEALVTAAAAAVEAATGDAEAWRAPWRVLVAVAGILPYPDSEVADNAIARLRDTADGRVLPKTPRGPVVTGPVLWSRDRYGSRFAVVAPITMVGQPVRWYLWDVDTCGHATSTVHSGFYPTQEAAWAAWQAGVGPIATAGTTLASVDDPWLLADLMFVDDGFRTGGESAEQFAESYRSQRLGEVVKRAVKRRGSPPNHSLYVATAAVEFAAWLRARDADHQELSAEMAELVMELADSWCINGVGAVFATCSPHRVALCVWHVRNNYLEEFSEPMVALLPEWTRWLAARNGTPPELADRCLPYAQGEPHPQVGVDRSEPNDLARVIE